MKETDFKKWGTFRTKGILRISDPCELLSKTKPKKVTLPAGTYEVLACAVSKFHESKNEEDSYTETNVAAIALKKPNAKLNFSKLKLLFDNLPETTRAISLVEENHFKTLTEETQEHIQWSYLSPPKSTLLQGDERMEYGWWETIAIREKFLVAGLMQYNGKFYVYQSPGVLLISVLPLDKDLSGYSFLKSKSEFFKTRAQVIRTNFLKKYFILCEMAKHCKVPKEKAKEDALRGKIVGPESHRLLDQKINELYQK